MNGWGGPRAKLSKSHLFIQAICYYSGILVYTDKEDYVITEPVVFPNTSMNVSVSSTNITIIDDSAVEGVENFVVVLQVPNEQTQSGVGSSSGELNGQEYATITIVDNDGK